MKMKFGLFSLFSRLAKALWRSTDGAALVEATVLTPVLVVLFFGVFEFSWYFYNQQLVEIGVRDAARYLARGPYISVSDSFVGEEVSPCDDATNKANAAKLAVYGTTDITINPPARVKSWTTADVTILCGDGSPTGTTFIPNSTGPYAHPPNRIWIVTVSTSFADPALGFFGLLGLGTPSLSASHKERSIGSG